MTGIHPKVRGRQLLVLVPVPKFGVLDWRIIIVFFIYKSISRVTRNTAVRVALGLKATSCLEQAASSPSDAGRVVFSELVVVSVDQRHATSFIR